MYTQDLLVSLYHNRLFHLESTSTESTLILVLFLHFGGHSLVYFRSCSLEHMLSKRFCHFHPTCPRRDLSAPFASTASRVVMSYTFGSSITSSSAYLSTEHLRRCVYRSCHSHVSPMSQRLNVLKIFLHLIDTPAVVSDESI